jgi:UDP-N-acetylmuramate--alanine ligase
MSAIATVLLQMGYQVAGSDLKESANVRRLRDQGAVIGLGHRAENLGEAGVVVRSSAVSADNPEISEALSRGIPVISRAEMLSAIMREKKGIAVAGTHGKTTTSSMVTTVLAVCGVEPAFLIGGELNEIGTNAGYGSGEYLVAEADESDGSLLCLRPLHAVLTNVELDHTDFFEDVEHTARVFEEFLGTLPEGGFSIVCGDDPGGRKVGEACLENGGAVLFYGSLEDNDYRFQDESNGPGGLSYRALFRGKDLGFVTMTVAGMHNIYNSLAALAVAHGLGLDTRKAVEGLGGFKGVRRRFELVGALGGVEIIDDYAHHPTEVRAVLELASSLRPGRVVAVFQPHRYSRTGDLAGEFGASFRGADVVVVTDVYGAGEEPEPGVTGRLIADSILEAEPGKSVLYEPSRADLAGFVVPFLRQGDMVITMGAGDITQCAREILDLLASGSGE